MKERTDAVSNALDLGHVISGVTNLCWKTCISRPGLGKLCVPEPNLSLTDWLSWAAPGPVSEKLRYCACCCCCCCCCCASEKANKSLNSRSQRQNITSTLTRLEIRRRSLRSAGNLQLAGPRNRRNVGRPSGRNDDLRLLRLLHYDPVGLLHVAKALRNAFRSTSSDLRR